VKLPPSKHVVLGRLKNLSTSLLSSDIFLKIIEESFVPVWFNSFSKEIFSNKVSLLRLFKRSNPPVRPVSFKEIVMKIRFSSVFSQTPSRRRFFGRLLIAVFALGIGFQASIVQADQCPTIEVTVNGGQRIITAAVRDEVVRQLEKQRDSQADACMVKAINDVIKRLKDMKF
jgi:hypothetical protein